MKGPVGGRFSPSTASLRLTRPSRILRCKFSREERLAPHSGSLLNPEVKNILLVRTDRIGDVILSLPMLPLLKRRFPGAAISVLVRQYTRELVEHHSCVDEVLIYENEGSIASLWSMLLEIRARKFDAAIIPYPRFRPTLILFLAGIRIRVGSGYRWYSFLFNRRIYEHRKDARRHEVEYNLNLLSVLGVDPASSPEFEIRAQPSAEAAIDSLLRTKGIGPGDRFAVLHPGSGGSARDWPAANFSKLGNRISSGLGLKLVVTGGKGEEVLANLTAGGIVPHAISFAGILSLGEMAALLRRASVFVSNSTGPMHIAAVVGTPVVAFFPPILQCSPVRWGPYTKKKRVFVADNGTCPLCEGGPCRSNVCMEQIDVQKVFEATKDLINE